ncbi:MAG: hypothetical protein IKG15_04155 [Solobacterium sp.]|nr:hypothetical protein [Solobacterium sp.]
MKLQVLFPDGKREELIYDRAVTAQKIIRDHEEHCPHPVYFCRIGGVEKQLYDMIEEDAEVELLDIVDPYANMAYQSSLILLYVKAVHDILGKDVPVAVANSLSKGLFTTIRKGNPSDEKIAEIEKRMHDLVMEDIPFVQKKMTREKAIRFFRDNGNSYLVRLLESAPDMTNAYLCSLDDETDISYTIILPSTGKIDLFQLRRYRNGILLRFPHRLYPDRVPPYQEQRLLYDAFSEETQWNKIMNVHYAADLNAEIGDGEYKELVLVSEALHEKKIAEIAGVIAKERKRIILIAGPSASGKTTFAKRLCIQLRVRGLRPLYLGTDDYFLNRDEMIPDENGNKDFECLEAVNIGLFTEQMNQLLDGKKVDIPEFDFITGKKVFGRRITSIEKSQPIVIEGIHGLNPRLTEGINDDEKFKIYISPLTQLNIDTHHRIPTTDARMIRRIVRDHRTRGRDAVTTITGWPSVRAGEEKYIFPFNEEADVFFNSQCLYELSALKHYAEPLLEAIPPESPAYPEAQRMLAFLQCFVEMTDDSIIPNQSIVREFIGGSVLMNEE